MLWAYSRQLGFALIGAVCGLTQANAVTLAEIRHRGYLVVAVPAEPSALGSINAGKLAGFDGDLLDKLGKSASLKIRQIVVPRADLAAMLETRKADLAASSIEVTEELQRSVDFGPPTAEAALYYLRRKGDQQVKSVADLTGRPFGVLSGSDNFLHLTELEHTLAKVGAKLGTPTEFATEADAEQDLTAGKVDYVINALTALEVSVQYRPDAFDLGQRLGHKAYVGWPMTKGNEAIAGLLKEFMAREQQTGDLASVQRTWLGASFPDLPDTVTAKDWWVAREDHPKMFPIPTLKDPD